MSSRLHSASHHRRFAVALAAPFAWLLLAGPAHAAEGTWERAWGKDVISGNAETGFEICTVAAACQGEATGGAGGEFAGPEGVATDAAGAVYVAEVNNDRIQKFDSAGNWERAWGKNVVAGNAEVGFEICTVAANCKEAGTSTGAGGELNGPVDVATDAAGNVYVVDVINQRIEKFDAAGNWQRAWGKDVVTGGGTGFERCTVAANCQAGTAGGLGGEFNFPQGIGTDAAGDVYVADTFNQRIQKFDSAGTWERAWGKDVVTGGGTGFEKCIVAANCQTGTQGILGGEFRIPIAVATDAAGAVYVADFTNERIQKFDSSGNFRRTWGRDVISTNAGAGFEICMAAAECKQAVPDGSLGGELNNPQGVATDAAGAVYVADGANQRIQRFDAAGNWQRAWGKDVDTAGGTGFEICTVAANCQAGATGTLGGELNDPTGLATDTAGNVYVADFSNHRIQRFAPPSAPPPPPPPPPDGEGTPPPDGQAPAKADRTLTLDANKGKVRKGRKVRLSGQLEATGNDPACEQDQSVEILRTGLKGGTPKQVATEQTDAQGNFALKLRVRKSSLYTAHVAETSACEPGSSDDERVRVKKKQ